MNITFDEENLTRLTAVAARSRLTLPFVITAVLSPIDIPAWLMSRPEPRLVYWRDREGKIEIGGVGRAMPLPYRPTEEERPAFEETMASCPDRPMVFPSFHPFDPKRPSDPAWRPFAADRCVIPEAMIIRRGDAYFFQYCFPVSPDADLATLKARLARTPLPDGSRIDTPTKPCALRPTAAVYHPDIDGWRRIVTDVLRAIEAGRVNKVVLARRIDYICERPVEPFALFQALRGHDPTCYAIYHQLRPGVAFLSFTPERLYRRDGREIAVDALSSTVLRGTTSDEDRRLEAQLRGDEKQNREHRFVVDGVTAGLDPICRERPRIGATSVMKLTRIQHLWTPITGRLNETVTDDTVMERLHPTPAMGGTPRTEAMEMIRRLESFDRGLYAAPWGYASADEAEFAVGIRSMRVTGDVVSVFTGAGIVAGSEPDREWQELDGKNILRPLIEPGGCP